MSAEQHSPERASVPPVSRRSSGAPRRISIPPSVRTSSRPPRSTRSALAPASIRSQLCCENPPIILVEFTGRISLPDILGSRDFGNIVKSLGGTPFRVLCDLTQTIPMPAEVCAVFARAQEFAVARGMERDAFVCSSSVLRLQFARIARESGRIGSLGPLRFFDSIDHGRAYLMR